MSQPRPLDRAGLCHCGLGVALHFDAANRKLTCEEALEWLTRRADGDTRGRALPLLSPVPFPLLEALKGSLCRPI